MDLMEQINKNSNGSNNLNLKSSNSDSNVLNNNSVDTLQDTINYNYTITAEEKQADILLDNLLLVQQQNIEQLKLMFEEYQPNPFGKAWGNDPDYVNLSNKLKVMLATGQKIKISEILNEKKSTGKKKIKSKLKKSNKK